MNQLLSTLIGKHFFFSSATIKLITEIILALIHIRDVNLTSIALVICQGTQVNSGYKKLQRFFAKIKICEVSLSVHDKTINMSVNSKIGEGWEVVIAQ